MKETFESSSSSSELPVTAKCPFCAHSFEITAPEAAAVLRLEPRKGEPRKIEPREVGRQVVRAPRPVPTMFRGFVWLFRKILTLGPGRWFHDFDVEVVLSDTRLLLDVMSAPLAFMFTIVAAIGAGAIALVTGNIHAATVVMMGGVFCAGFLQRESPWRFWVLVAAAIPAAYGLSEEFGISLVSMEWQPRDVAFSLILPLPSVYVGVFVRFILGKLSPPKIDLPTVQVTVPARRMPLAAGGHSTALR